MRLALVTFAACASTPKKATKQQQAKMCRPAIDHLVQLMTNGQTGSVPMAEQIRAALFERCAVDQWGGDAAQCFATIATIETAESCARYLTIPQRDGFQQAIEGAAR